MTAAVRKKDEELTINLKCIIGVLMTDSGLAQMHHKHKDKGQRRLDRLPLSLFIFDYVPCVFSSVALCGVRHAVPPSATWIPANIRTPHPEIIQPEPCRKKHIIIM